MGNIIDYLHWRGDLSFKKDPLNDLDNMILSELCYIDYSDSVSLFPSKEKTTLFNATNSVFEHVDKEDIVLGLIMPSEIIELADIAIETNRYKNIYMSNYINEVDKFHCMQFSAITFHLPNNMLYIAFRGTDDTLIGWQEDLDMVCKFPIPAQKMAVKYLHKIAKLFPDEKIILGGHSKGGNLATYAAIYCFKNVKDRIVKVYNNDGPGFHTEHIDLEKYELVKHKITRIIPFESVIGVVFDNFSGNTIIVDSKVKGVYQHDAFSWLCQRTSFEEVEKLSDNSVKLDMAITAMLEKMTSKDRIDFASNIYDFIVLLNQNTLTEVNNNKFSFIKKLNRINNKSKKIFMELMYNFIRYNQV